MAGIYIHIPFCKKACHYCNFHFSTSLNAADAFIMSLLLEIELRKEYILENIGTIYFGGGTPSLLTADQLQTILYKIKSTFTVDADAEITLEANPDDISLEKLHQWKQTGINRLSVGIQSFFDEDLLWMNRAHNAQQATDSIEWIKKAGFNNFTIDLIYGTPSLSEEQWKKNIENAIALGIKHISCYALTVEPKTALAVLINQKKMEDISQEVQARHFEILLQTMENAGYEHYEISNFCVPGFRSKHNSSYWQGKPYIGLGPSAHSFNMESRQWNVSNNGTYIDSLQKGILPFEMENLTPEQKINEWIMTSLRTIEGISLLSAKKRFGEEKSLQILKSARAAINAGHLHVQNETLLLTKEGKLFADGIASDLFVV